LPRVSLYTLLATVIIMGIVTSVLVTSFSGKTQMARLYTSNYFSYSAIAKETWVKVSIYPPHD
jgi:type II secretory pathway pseudopilin PulG